MRQRLVLKTAVVAALVAVAVSIAVVVAQGGGEADRPSAAASAQPVATPVARLTAPSAGRWKSGVQPLLAAGPASAGASSNCPRQTKSRPRPADFPASFPLPAKTVVTGIRRHAPRGATPVVYVIGHAPLSLEGAGRFFVRELPLRAYYITSSEAEPIEAEARFDGPAKGALRVIAIPGCSSVVWMLVGVLKRR